jgi:dTDP-4-dehydrorhamnose 3,5-epimerase
LSHASNQTTAFTEGPIDGVILKPLKAYTDHRGWLTELYREDELSGELHPVMAYVSETLPGVARGPHEHVDQTDYFAFVGPGDFLLYLWDARPDSPTRGHCMKVVVGESNKQCAIVPPGVVHAYKNTGATPGWVFNLPNRLYAGPGKREPVDEIRHEDKAESVYRME